MFKYAFLINLPGYSPESFFKVYENEESYNLFAGTDNMDAAKEYVKKLADEGFTLFNLCGDFDDEITAAMQESVGEGVKIRHADYFPEELAKVEALEEFNRYGVVAIIRGVEEPIYLDIKCDDFYAKIALVKDQEQSNAAARKLAEDGMHDIELCSWFDKEKTEEVIAAVGGLCPVGTCGL